MLLNKKMVLKANNYMKIWVNFETAILLIKTEMESNSEPEIECSKPKSARINGACRVMGEPVTHRIIIAGGILNEADNSNHQTVSTR